MMKSKKRYLVTIKAYEAGSSPSYDDFRKLLDKIINAIVSVKLFGEDIYCTLFAYYDKKELVKFFEEFEPSRILYTGEKSFITDLVEVIKFSKKKYLVTYAFMTLSQGKDEAINKVKNMIKNNLVFAADILYPKFTSLPTPLLHPIKLYNFLCVFASKNIKEAESISNQLKRELKPDLSNFIFGVKHGWHTLEKLRDEQKIRETLEPWGTE